ncbi:MAG: MoaD/ThiS family protein [Acidobacteriia bacterium]|nr:MoaD/ThiS family protein [Terriglobia bacterium]
MSHRIVLPTPLRRFAGNADSIDVEAETIGEIIERIETLHPGFRDRICEPNGELRRFINIYLNGEDVRFLEKLATKIPAGAEVAIIPAIAGG